MDAKVEQLESFRLKLLENVDRLVGGINMYYPGVDCRHSFRFGVLNRILFLGPPQDLQESLSSINCDVGLQQNMTQHD
jgi:hypothetical protein